MNLVGVWQKSVEVLSNFSYGHIVFFVVGIYANMRAMYLGHSC